MKIFIKKLPFPIEEDKTEYPIVSIETVGNRCILRAEDKETLDLYKLIMTSKDNVSRFSEDDEYIVRAVSSDYGTTVNVVGNNKYSDSMFSKDSSGLPMSVAFKFKK